MDQKKFKWSALTGAGQVEPGDWLEFRVGDSTISCAAVEVLFAGTEKEEIVYNRVRNHYFITRMVVDGTSSHKNVRVGKVTTEPGPVVATWVSVEDRLPPKSGIYPACSVAPTRRPPDDWLDALCSYDADAKKRRETPWQHSSGFYDGAITHWLELTTPVAPSVETC